MSEPHVITALVRKRGQLAGEIENVKNRLDDLIASLETIDDAIRVFDPDYAVVGIRPIEFRARSSLTKRGELPRMLLDILREAGRPMTAPEIVAEVMKRKGIADDKRLVRHMTIKVNAALRRHRKKGAIKSTDGPDMHLLWTCTS